MKNYKKILLIILSALITFFLFLIIEIISTIILSNMIKKSDFPIYLSMAIISVIFCYLIYQFRKKIKISVKIIFIFLFLLNIIISFYISGFINKSVNGPFVSDQIKIIDKVEYKSETYYINLVTSGFAEKEQFIKISKGKISYDKYGNEIYDNIVWDFLIDHENVNGSKNRNFSRIIVDKKNEKLIVVYSNNENDVFELKKVLK